MRATPVPLLLLKLSAAVVTGAAMLLTFRRLNREEALASLRRDVRVALLPLLQDLRRRDGAAPGPPAVLVFGFRAQGKSSLVNTVCRALAAESGPFLLRAEAAPSASTPATPARHVVRAAVAPDAGGREDGEEMVVELVDAPPLPEWTGMTRADVEAALEGNRVAPAPECVVVVLRCAPPKERHAAIKRLTDIATVIRDRGLSLVVVLTHRKALKTKKQAEDLRKEVATRARTDCVFFIENYTTGSSLNISCPTVIKNDFETHFTVLAIIRQCLEFTVLYRSRSAQKPNVTSAHPTIKSLSVNKEQ